jgi:hypothetical protein
MDIVEPWRGSSSNVVVPTMAAPSTNEISIAAPSFMTAATDVTVKRTAAAFPDSVLCAGHGCRRGVQFRVVPVSTTDNGSFDANIG